MQNFIYIDKLSFNYENCINPLFDNLSFQLQKGWTGVVGANGSGKTTLLMLMTRKLQPESGSIKFSGNCYYCEQRTDFMPTDFKNFVQTNDKAAFKLKNVFQILLWLGRAAYLQLRRI